jgi:hypothetical protein
MACFEQVMQRSPTEVYEHFGEMYCPCGLVVRVLGYRSSGLGSIPGATKFSENWWVWNGVHSAL